MKAKISNTNSGENITKENITKENITKENKLNLTGPGLEWGVFIIFILLTLVMYIFHEPWFDEAQAWQIAKCASYKDMIFYYPHLEGHPAFWFLILSIPAKLGVPYEIGLKTVGLIFALIAGYLLIFKTNFYRPVKLLIPFTYFVFFQYVVIVRPYIILLIGFILAGLVFDQKDQKPYLFVGSLALMCTASTFGIIMAGGIALAWCIDILLEYWGRKSLGEFIKDKRLIPLTLLLIFAIIVVISIIPDANAVGTNLVIEDNTLLERIIFVFTGLLADATCLDTAYSDAYITSIDFSNGMLLPGVIIGLVVWILVVGYSSKKKLKYFVIPYVLTGIFILRVYFAAHHIGIVFDLLIFFMLIMQTDPDKGEVIKIKNIKGYLKAFIIFTLVISLYWSGKSIYEDIRCPFGNGRDMQAFIKENGLDKLNIWRKYISDMFSEDEEEKICVTGTGTASTYLAYFDSNIIANLNDGDDSKAFVINRVATDEENEKAISKWKNLPQPDVLIGKVDLTAVYGEENLQFDYIPVYEMKRDDIWKGRVEETLGYIYLRKDLADEYGLEEIDTYIFAE